MVGETLWEGEGEGEGEMVDGKPFLLDGKRGRGANRLLQ